MSDNNELNTSTSVEETKTRSRRRTPEQIAHDELIVTKARIDAKQPKLDEALEALEKLKRDQKARLDKELDKVNKLETAVTRLRKRAALQAEEAGESVGEYGPTSVSATSTATEKDSETPSSTPEPIDFDYSPEDDEPTIIVETENGWEYSEPEYENEETIEEKVYASEHENETKSDDDDFYTTV